MSCLAIGSLDSRWLISEQFRNPWSTSHAFKLCADGPFPRAVAWNPHAHVQLHSHTQRKHFFVAAFFSSLFPPQEKPLHLLMDSVLELPCQNDFPNGKSNGASHWQRRPPHLQLGTRDTPSPDVRKCSRSWLGVYALLISYLSIFFFSWRYFYWAHWWSQPSGKHQASPHWGKPLLRIFPLMWAQWACSVNLYV